MKRLSSTSTNCYDASSDRKSGEEVAVTGVTDKLARCGKWRCHEINEIQSYLSRAAKTPYSHGP